MLLASGLLKKSDPMFFFRARIIHVNVCLQGKKKILEYCRPRRRGTLFLVVKTEFVTLNNYVFFFSKR